MLIHGTRGLCSTNYSENVLQNLLVETVDEYSESVTLENGEKWHYFAGSNLLDKIIGADLNLVNDWENTHDLLETFNNFGMHDICNDPNFVKLERDYHNCPDGIGEK